MNKALPVPRIRKLSSKDERTRLAKIERRISNLEKRMDRVEDSSKDKPKITEKQFFGRMDSDSDDEKSQSIEKSDTYSDLDDSSDSKSLSGPDPEANDEFIASKEIWNMRSGEKQNSWDRMNNQLLDFIKTLSPRKQEKGMTIDQLRRQMEIFFDLKLTNHCTGKLANFKKYFYKKGFYCGKAFLFLYFPKNQQE